jgi:hypothetical protein
MRARLCMIAAVAACSVAALNPAGAEEPNLDQTKAYLIEKLPIFIHNIQPNYGQPAMTTLSMSFESCTMSMRFGDPRVGQAYMIDFKITEPVQARADGHGSSSATVFSAGYRPGIIFSYSYNLGIGKGDQVRKSTISQVDFFTRDDETPQRLARALNQLRKLRGAQPESDPFATH